MPVVVEAREGVSGGLRIPGAVGGLFDCDPGAPSDAAFSKAVVPRTARLKDCEFRDKVPRALLRSSSRDIVAPAGGAAGAAWVSVRDSEFNKETYKHKMSPTKHNLSEKKFNSATLKSI